MTRLNGSQVAPEGAKALFGVHHYATESTALPEEMTHLIRRSTAVRIVSTCAHATC